MSQNRNRNRKSKRSRRNYGSDFGKKRNSFKGRHRRKDDRRLKPLYYSDLAKTPPAPPGEKWEWKAVTIMGKPAGQFTRTQFFGWTPVTLREVKDAHRYTYCNNLKHDDVVTRNSLTLMKIDEHTHARIELGQQMRQFASINNIQDKVDDKYTIHKKADHSIVTDEDNRDDKNDIFTHNDQLFRRQRNMSDAGRIKSIKKRRRGK